MSSSTTPSWGLPTSLPVPPESTLSPASSPPLLEPLPRERQRVVGCRADPATGQVLYAVERTYSVVTWKPADQVPAELKSAYSVPPPPHLLATSAGNEPEVGACKRAAGERLNIAVQTAPVTAEAAPNMAAAAASVSHAPKTTATTDAVFQTARATLKASESTADAMAGSLESTVARPSATQSPVVTALPPAECLVPSNSVIKRLADCVVVLTPPVPLRFE